MKCDVSLEMGYFSGFASLGRGAILKRIQDGLHKVLVGGGWGSHRGHIPMRKLKAWQDPSQTVSGDPGEGHSGQREQCESNTGKQIQSSSREDTGQRVIPDKGSEMLGEEV